MNNRKKKKEAKSNENWKKKKSFQAKRKAGLNPAENE